MIDFDEVKGALAQAIFNLLAVSDEQEWFTVNEITTQASVKLSAGLVSRVLTLSEEEEGEIFSSSMDNGTQYWTLARGGFDLVDTDQGDVDQRLIDIAPAADRIVEFNHNSQEAQNILNQIDNVIEAVRGINEPGVEEQERRRVSQALEIAKELWQSGHFKVIQFKIGVALAVQDAVDLLANTAKAVAVSLLSDALKSFAKRHFHIELDAI